MIGKWMEALRLAANPEWRSLKGRAAAELGAHHVEYARAEIAPGGLKQTHFVPLNTLGRPASRAILKGKYYEPHTHAFIEKLLTRRPGDMVHAGAFFGDMLPSFAAKCSGRIYAFEPTLDSYLMASNCVEENDLENVLLFNAGLSQSTGNLRVRTVHRRTGKYLGGGARLQKESHDGRIVPTMAVDMLGIEDLSVLQLDLEGHERFALRGARQTVARCRPVVLLEDVKLRCAKIMEELGYERIGEIPALHVWTVEEDAAEVKALIEAVTA